MYIQVALNIPREQTFSYHVPEVLERKAMEGKRVIVPLGKRAATGFIISCGGTPGERQDIREIYDIADREPLFTEKELRFYRWVAQYYLYPLGKALFDIIPTGGAMRKESWIVPEKPDSHGPNPSDLPGSPELCSRIMAYLSRYPAGVPQSRLERSLGVLSITREIEVLREQGAIAVESRYRSTVRPRMEEIVALDPRYLAWRGVGGAGGDNAAPAAEGDGAPRGACPDWRGIRLTRLQHQFVEYLLASGTTGMSQLRQQFNSASSLAGALQKKGILCRKERDVFRKPPVHALDDAPAEALTLNADQKQAVRQVVQGLRSRCFSPYLLHGVTGGGKTEVYLRVMERTRQAGGAAMLLVPEIGLTPQLLGRIRARFPGEEIGVIHSGITKQVRYDQWRRIQRGEIKIVVGARSALFVPLRDLRLIVVDEEHDSSYKQDERLRYNARDMAVVRAKMDQAVIVLGSATPAIQSYFNARQRKYHYLRLPERIERRTLPPVETVDMRMARDDTNHVPVLSRTLWEAIGHTLAEKNQILLFLNRRGFHTLVLCTDCGHVMTCLNCDVALTFHAGTGILTCHYCGFSRQAFPRCPGCAGTAISRYGVGTERLAEEVRRLFPAARIERMDSDTTSRRGEAERILRALARRELDVLVGTQMITKGHDFPHITLVGVIAADLSLNVPDFRAAEKTFQILTQVAGRGGRGEKPGRVIVQTFNPGHYAICRAQNHDYQGFYEDEIQVRKSLVYPPYSRLVILHISSSGKERGLSGIDRLMKIVRHFSQKRAFREKMDILGPAESPVFRMKGRYRWQILLKARDIQAQIAVIAALQKECGTSGLEIKVDVDPMSFA